jgi:hypothetical protein
LKNLRTKAKHQWLTLIILATQEAEIRRITVQARPGKQFIRPYLPKYPTRKKAGGVTQVVEHLPSKVRP